MVIVCAIAGVLVLAHTHRQSSTGLPVIVTTATTQQAPRASTDTQLVKAIRVFADAYGRYLDGGPATVLRNGGKCHVSSAGKAGGADPGRVPRRGPDGHRPQRA